MTSPVPASDHSPDVSILLLGAGRMGAAMLRGWLAQGVPGSAIAVIDPTPTAELQALAGHAGFHLNPAGTGHADILVAAVKPQMVAAAAPAVEGWLSGGSLVVSIMAGKTLADLKLLFPAAGAHVRAMPNLPAAVGRGATVAVAGPGIPADVLAGVVERAGRLLGAVGSLEWLEDEALVDAATAVSGSGPAYVFYMVDCLTNAGVEAGLPPEVAERLARATVEGAGALMGATGQSAADLRAGVTSPGGTTQAGLSVLMADGILQGLLSSTVRAAAARARELGGVTPAPAAPAVLPVA
ncbi:pyrroline-5-carboxylate reductase [Azospirillum picis]|uniref:Pyrroline-5-carboxylate reductase n=1 Tax=Azospirillum picis TaxID=488438 RepID=A0ABU0MK09_9PROT|nr:pyrroline-5-carboxylate reductase [Azospirillum picis]MBP2299817.1 pyrroline-5-carboxylate reductase [Azospirillum picis]MDQ0533613.1 pyrroline-5-carboxylate reductase [Azospirillum picis]